MRFRLLAAAAVALLVTADVLAGGPLTRLDGWVSGRVRAGGLPSEGAGDPGARWLDLLLAFGDRLVVIPVVLVALAWIGLRERTAGPLVRLAVLGVATLLVVYGLKVGIARPPPPGLQYAGPPRSYPSGHTATAVVLWGLLARCAAERPRAGPSVRVAAVLAWLAPLVTMVGMLLRDYHWVTDMVAAAALGVILLQAERAALRHWRGARRRPAAAGAPAGDAAAPRPRGRG